MAAKSEADKRIEAEAEHANEIARINNTVALQAVVDDGDSTVEALEEQLKEAKARRDQYKKLLDDHGDSK